MYAGFLGCFPLFILLIISAKRRREVRHAAKIRIKRRNGDTEMQELAKRFIGKDVYIKTVGGETEDGILKEVVDNAAVIEKDGKSRVINLDYVVRLMEYPKNKKGRRKALVVD